MLGVLAMTACCKLSDSMVSDGLPQGTRWKCKEGQQIVILINRKHSSNLAKSFLIVACRKKGVCFSPIFFCSVDKTSQPQYQHHHQAQHGVGRKVKNKMKSGMSSTPLLSSSPGMTLHGGSSLGVPGGAGDSPSIGSSTGAVNKLRGYQHFLVCYSF